MTVSVILPTHNRAYIVSEAIQSVLCQTYPNFELLIIDDGSSDNTDEVVARFKDRRIRLIRHGGNLGVSAAWNSGLQHCSGELLAFLASDDLWKPKKLDAQVGFLARHPELGGVFSDLEWLTGRRRVASMLSEYPVFSGLVGQGCSEQGIALSRRSLYVCLLEEMAVKLQAAMLRRDCVDRIGPFPACWRSGEDWEFLLRFARLYALGYLPYPLTVQRTLADSTLVRYKKLDALCLMERFIAEGRSLRGDPEASAAVRRGIARFANEVGYQCLKEGDRRGAFGAYYRGFKESGDFGQLVRCAGAMLPRRAWALAKRLKRGTA